MQTNRSPHRNILKACYIIPLIAISIACSAKTKELKFHYQDSITESDIVQVKSYHKSAASWIKKNAHEMLISTDMEANAVKISYFNQDLTPIEATVSDVDFGSDSYIYDNKLISKNEAARLTGINSLIYDEHRMLYSYRILDNGKKIHVLLSPAIEE